MFLAGLLIACEKPVMDEDEPSAPIEQAKGNLYISIFQIDQTPFPALSRNNISDVCSHLNFAVYDMNGTRLKQTNQKVGDSNFGATAFQLDAGSYQLVTLAHSSHSNPTMTNPNKIQFTNASGFSDTFLYYTILDIGDEAQTLSLSLERIVALCRFVINDSIPKGVSSLRFLYKGGSGAFDATTGLGCVKSTQSVNFDVEEGQKSTEYDLYTFLHDEEGTIHLEVTAYDKEDNIIRQREFDIPMHQNAITHFDGNFFIDDSFSGSHPVTTILSINNKWGKQKNLHY